MSPPSGGAPAEGGSTFQLVFLSAGVLASFIAFGYAQEAVTKTPFGAEGELFKFSTFLVLLQSVGNAAVAAAVLFAKTGRKTNLNAGVPLKDWLVVALGYFGAHKLGLSALAYISFPLQVICKSCKAIPVMAGERVFTGKRHSTSQVCGVFMMCAGVVMFTLLGPRKSSGSGMELDAKMAFGLLLVLGALVCDGVYGPYQNKITKAHGPTAYHLMFNMNLYQGLLSLALCLAHGEVGDALAFCAKHGSAVVKLLALFSAAMALGNIFIYQLQHSFGALTVTTVTTLRKLTSVLFSVFLFGHSLSLAQWAAVFVVVFYKVEGDLLAKLVGGQKPVEKSK